jgi:hypothetical protein
VTKRPVSVSHLVFGLIFLGAGVLWVIGAATDADAPDMAVLAPAVLIGAGVAGLIAIVLNARNARISAGVPATEGPATEDPTTEDPTTQDPEYADTGVLDHEEQ